MSQEASPSFDNDWTTPLATPYPWIPEEVARYKKLDHLKKQKKRVTTEGQGTRLLKSCLGQVTNPKAKAIMEELLSNQQSRSDFDQPTATDTEPHNVNDVLRVDTAHIDDVLQLPENEAALLARAQEGKTSLFLSLLQVISQASTKTPATVSTRHLLRTCSLAVHPRHVPPHMDCKEYVLAALFFLSSTAQDDSSCLFGTLPLIICQAAVPQDDLEKRIYEKHGTWSLEDMSFLEQMLRLENMFGTSSQDWIFLGRQRHVPLHVVQGHEKKLLLLKGTLPSSSRIKSQAGSKKRKAASTISTKREVATPTPPPPTPQPGLQAEAAQDSPTVTF